MPLDQWTDEPPPGNWPKWVWGGVAPSVLLATALRIAYTGEGWLPGRRWRRGFEFHGTDAYLYALAIFGLAAFLHCHYFWGNARRLEEYSIMGKLAALAIFVPSLLALLYRIFAGF